MTIDLSNIIHDDSRTFEQRRFNISRILRKIENKWWTHELDEQLAELENAPDQEALEAVLDEIYVRAFSAQVFIKTV